jgi:hypothetical protein
MIYLKDGKQFRKISRNEIIKEGAYHNWSCGELHRIVNSETIGKTPNDFGSDREFFNLLKTQKEDSMPQIRVDIEFECEGCGKELKYTKDEVNMIFQIRPCLDCEEEGKEIVREQLRHLIKKI